MIFNSNPDSSLFQSGFLGHTTDAAQYRLIAPVGPGRQLSLPGRCLLLADKIYPNELPLLTAWKRHELGRGLQEQRRRLFNIEHAHYRVGIEHVNKRIKEYRILKERFRHPLDQLTKVVDLCACLANRHIEFIEDIR